MAMAAKRKRGSEVLKFFKQHDGKLKRTVGRFVEQNFQ